jgi:hypothetical protein
MCEAPLHSAAAVGPRSAHRLSCADTVLANSPSAFMVHTEIFICLKSTVFRVQM